MRYCTKYVKYNSTKYRFKLNALSENGTLYRTPVCPVFWLNYYIATCGALGVPLLGAYLFRSSEHKKFVKYRSFGGSAVSARLQKYLKAAGINDGETPHSFRVGISYTLKGLGCAPELTAQYVGWRSTEMALYYTRHPSASVSLQLLVLVTLNLTSSGSPPALQLSDQENLQRISYSWIASFMT